MSVTHLLISSKINQFSHCLSAAKNILLYHYAVMLNFLINDNFLCFFSTTDRNKRSDYNNKATTWIAQVSCNQSFCYIFTQSQISWDCLQGFHINTFGKRTCIVIINYGDVRSTDGPNFVLKLRISTISCWGLSYEI
jgi:hypothetical protein